MAKKSKAARTQANLVAKPVGGMVVAADWPVLEVLLSRRWDQPNTLTTILIARRSPASGKVAAALLLVDLACLGVKSAQVKMFKSVEDYRAGLRAHAQQIQSMAPADLDLVAKIVYTGLQYAAMLGFKPDPVFTQAQPLLNGADWSAVETPVPTGGIEGKPTYFNGPNDDPRRIVAQLVRAVGEGNFHYYVQGSKEELGLPDDIDRLFDEARR